MRLRSILIVLGVLAVFVGVQWWVVQAKYLRPKHIQAHRAVLQGVTLDVGAPVSGVISDVSVTEDQRVSQGQTLFVIAPQFGGSGGGAPVPITAQRSGIITDIVVTQGGFISASERMARIIDNSPEAVRIQAALDVRPGDLAFIRAAQKALVSAPFLDDGRPLEAVITSVDPEYDADHQSLDVRLRLLEYPEGGAALALGAPVDVDIPIENRNRLRTAVDAIRGDARFRGFLQWIAELPVPFSNAQQ